MSDLTNFLLASLNGTKEPTAHELDTHSPARPTAGERPISSLKLTPSVQQALMLAGVQSLEQLLEKSGADLLLIPGIDVVSAAEIKKIVARFQTGNVPLAPRLQLSTSYVIPGHIEVPNRPSPPEHKLTQQIPTTQGPASTVRQKPLSVLELPTGYVRALERYGIRTVDELCRLTIQDLVGRMNLGQAAGKTIQRAVERKGWTLASEQSTNTPVVKAPYRASRMSEESRDRTDLQAKTAHPNGPGKWLLLAFASLTSAERNVLVARTGLDGKGVRDVDSVAVELGLSVDTVVRMESVAKVRVRHSLHPTLLPPLVSLYEGVMRNKGQTCSLVDLAEAVGHPDSGDGYDALAFTRFILQCCPGLRDAIMDRIDTDRQDRAQVVKESPSQMKDDPRSQPDTSADPSAQHMTPVTLADIRIVEARLVVLAAALAADARRTVDFRRLKDFAEGAGLWLTETSSIDLEVGSLGIRLDTGQAGELHLLSSIQIILSPNDLPGKLTDLDFLRTILPKAGVLRDSTTNVRNYPKVEFVRTALVNTQLRSTSVPLAQVPLEKASLTPAVAVVRLSSISGNSSRLLVLTAALAAERGWVLNAPRLQEFAEGAGNKLAVAGSVGAALRRLGIEFEEPETGHFRLVSPYRVEVNVRDLPGRLVDLAFMRSMLPKIGVIKPFRGVGTPVSEVRSI